MIMKITVKKSYFVMGITPLGGLYLTVTAIDNALVLVYHKDAVFCQPH